MNTIKVRSTVKAIPTAAQGNCYISRKIKAMFFDFENNTAKPEVLEQLFQEQEIELEGVMVTERKIIDKKYKQYFLKKAYTDEDIDGLFNFLATGILPTDSFMTEFRELNQNALLIDTQNIINENTPKYGLEVSEWIKDTPHVVVEEFTIAATE